MKKFLKWTAIIFIGLIVIGAVMGEEEETATPAVTETVTEEATAEEPAEAEATEEAAVEEEAPAEEPAEPANGPELTKAEFDQIENGMTYEEVVAIIGSEGELMSEVGAEGEQFYTSMYMWEGESLGSNANVTFQGSPAVVEMKAQFGLE